GLQLTRLEHPRPAVHCAQGGPQFVRENRQEIFLRAARGLSIALRALQLDFGQFALSDIRPNNKHAVRVAVGVSSDGRPELRRPGLEVLGPFRGLPYGVTAPSENALHARTKFSVCLLSRHLT